MIEIFAIHTAVLVGLLVAWIWTESYGGVFAGFAVPGYLAAIALVAPSAASTIVIEAVLTYGVVRLLGDGLPMTGLTGRVFGRERFLLFVVASVPIRLIVEGLASGGLGAALGPFVPGADDLGFYGVGLVLVPLTANTFWKLGLSRGVLQVAGTTGVTALVMAFAVMPLLQLDLSSFLLTLENISADFLAAPKVTVVLLSTAVVATWTAERYGWNAGGLLVPSLLALLVFGPVKLLTTVVEIILLMALYSVVTSLPGVRRLPLVGPRRLVAMYMLAWLLKVSLAWTGLQLELPVAAWDLYGFGYLLSSLVAVRCLDLRPPGRVLVPMGVNLAVGASLGLGAAVVLGWVLPGPQARALVVDPRIARIELAGDVVVEAGMVREDPGLSQDRSALSSLRRYLVGGVPGERLARADGTECLAWRPRTGVGPRTWWCGGEGPVLLVVTPRSDPDAVWLASRLLDQGHAAGLVMSGIDGVSSGEGGAGDVDRVTRIVPGRDVLLVRSQATGATSLAPRGALSQAVSVPGVDPVPLAFDGEVGPLAAAWEGLRDRDALLSVSVEEQQALLPEVPTFEGLPERPRQHRTEAHPGLPWLLHLGWSTRDPVSPRGLAWAAANAGVAVSVDEAGRIWLVEDSIEGFGAWALRPTGRGPWMVVGPRASEEPGIQQAALGLSEQLDGRATWLAVTGTRGLEPRLGQERSDTPLTHAFREALRPTGGRPDAAVVVVRRIAETVPDPQAVVLGQAAAAAPRDRRYGDDLHDAVDRLWPGAHELGATELGPPSIVGQQPLRYAQAMDPGRAWVLWLRRDVLAGARANPDHDEALRWYGLRGVPLVEEGRVVERFGVRLEEPVRDVALLDALDEHLESRTTRSIQVLRDAGEPFVLRAELRLGIGIVTGDRVCMRVAGAPVDAGFPHAGCWRRR